MTDERERVARALCCAAAGDKTPTPVPDELMPRQWASECGHWRALADAALAEIGGVRVEPLNEEERAEVINAAYEEYRKSQRGVRGQLITEWDSIESWVVQATEARILAAIEPAPVSVRDEGSEMKLAYDAYRKGQRDALDGIRVADPRVILSRVRAIAEGKDDE